MTDKFKRLKKIIDNKSLEQTIKYCIKHKLKMDFMYADPKSEGVLKGYRRVSPAALGILKSTENIAMRAYLNDGVSKSNHSPNWRLFRLDRIQSFSVYYNKFKIDGLYSMNDKHMSVIDSQLKKAFQNLLLC